jgi:N-acyl-L-homoserine lactone synthetase
VTSSCSGHDEALHEGDVIAADLLASLEPLRFEEAAGERDQEAAFRLRFRAVVEVGMAEVADRRDGVEADPFDASAVHILGWDGDRAIATCRLVLPSPGQRLPLEAAFDLELAPGEPVVEWGRVVVDPAYRGDGHSVFLGLAAQGWRSMRSRGFSAALGATPRRLLALFEALGFAITVLGPPRRYWGEERVPFLCEGRTTAPGLRRHGAEAG